MLAGDDLTIVLFFGTLVAGFGLEAVKAETAPRKVIFAVMTAACLLGALFWLQIKTIWPPFTDATISVGTNPVAWFVAFMFILAVLAFHPAKTRNRTAVVRPTNSYKPEKEERVVIDVSPTYLIDLYKDRTSIQGDALAVAYIGKWIVVTGKVRDIFETGDDGLTAQIYDKDEKFISARFSKEASKKISYIAHGTTITISGEVAAIDLMRVKLQNCNLDKVVTI